MKKVYLIAVIVAIIAGVATYMFATEINSKTKFKDAEMVTVLVPTADIEKNVEITADMFEGDNPQIVTKEILAADATDNYVKAQTELVDDAKDVHMITVDKLYANEPINKNRLEDKNGDDVALSLKLPKGMVAYSFDAGSVKSVDGYISEGDTVDVLVSKTDDQGKVKTEIAYKGLKILRVSTNADNSTASQSGTKITTYNTLTVEVTKKQSLKLYEIESKYDYKLILNPRQKKSTRRIPMSNINIVVCAEKTEYKVALKNKITSDELSIIGYADLQPDAKVRIQGFVPDVVVFVLDSEDINSDFFNFVEDINLASFGCSAIIMTDNVTVDIVNNAAQSGIRRVMSINVGNEEFTNTIKNVVGNEKKLNQNFNVTKKVRSRVYSFFSGKGGVGKTTICTNTAVYLATLGKKVLLVDLDLQFGDADMALDLNPSETIVDLARDTNGISIDNLSSCCCTHASGLSVLASPSSPELAEYIQSNHTKAIIDVARNYYEYIILDCGCALTDPVITALESSDDIFMVNDVNILSLKRAKLCQNVLSQINQQDKVKLIINKNVKKNNVKISDFENLLGIDAYAVISSDLKTVNSSLNSGQPLITYKPRAVIAKDISSFANKLIMEREGTLTATAKKKSFGKKK